jgi:hypothetical protein
MTAPPVIKQRLTPENPFRSWATKNAAQIAQRFPDVKHYGFYIVMSTYATRKASLNAWNSNAMTISIGFGAVMPEIGEIAPSGSWYAANSESGWIHSAAKVQPEHSCLASSQLKF